MVTDPTLPSVTLGATWVPPTLAALRVALTSCANFKVRIAAAQALGTTPSRAAYRIPGGFSEQALGPGAALAASGMGSGGEGAGAPGPAAAATAATAATPPAPALGAHTSPALQRPGYDAWPSAVEGLVTALLRCESAVDFSEYRYKEQLKGVIRVALLQTIQLAERMDYGRAKPFLDAHAELLLQWLCAEEALQLPPPGPAALAAAAEAEGAGGGGGGGGGGGSGSGSGSGAGGGGDGGRSEDAPVRTTSVAPRFGSLAPHPGVDLACVRACVVKLAAMFRSRVKTIPQALLKGYTAKAQEAQAALDAAKGEARALA